MMIHLITNGGVVLHENRLKFDLHPKNLAKEVLTWLVAGLILLLAATAAVMIGRLDTAYLGYICSAISFFAALVTGLWAAKNTEHYGLLSAIALALVLTVLPLTVGFLIGGKLDASGILSTASFTFAGCLSAVLLGGAVRSGTRHGRQSRSAYRKLRKGKKM